VALLSSALVSAKWFVSASVSLAESSVSLPAIASRLSVPPPVDAPVETPIWASRLLVVGRPLTGSAMTSPALARVPVRGNGDQQLFLAIGVPLRDQQGRRRRR